MSFVGLQPELAVVSPAMEVEINDVSSMCIRLLFGDAVLEATTSLDLSRGEQKAWGSREIGDVDVELPAPANVWLFGRAMESGRTLVMLL